MALITLTQSVNGLSPGWVLFKNNSHSFWHWRDDKGVVVCMKSKGAQVHIYRWAAEPGGKNQACPACRRTMMKIKEPEVLQVPEEQPSNDEKKETETVLVAKTDKQITITEAAELVGVKYMTMYHWATQRGSKLHYDDKAKTIPESDLDLLEELVQRRDAYLRKRGMRPAKPAAPSLPPIGVGPTLAELHKPKPSPERPGVHVGLTEQQLAIAGFLDLTPDQFVQWCITKACAKLIAVIK